MDSLDGKTEEEMLERTNEVFEDLDEPSFQNLAAEMRFKVELERDDLQCSYLKFEVDNAAEACSRARDCTAFMRKSLAETQTEMDQINDEIVKQKEAIENVCSDERVENFSNVIEAVSHAVGEYKELTLVLEAEAHKRNQYSLRIDETMQEIRNVSNLVNNAKKERENIVNQVECKTMKLRRYLEDASDEKIDLLKREFTNCMTLKNELLSLEVRKKELEDRWKESMENRQQIQDDIRNLSQRYDDLNAQCFEEFRDIRMENEVVLNEFESLKNDCGNDKYAQVRLLLNNMKSELNSFKKLSDVLRSRKNELENSITLQSQEIEMKEQTIRIEEDKTMSWEIEKQADEKTMHVLQDQMEVLEGNVSEVKNQLETLEDEISQLEADYESYCRMSEDELTESVNRDVLEKELGNLNRELTSLKTEENRVREVVEKLNSVEMQHLSQLQASTLLLEKLKSTNQEEDENLMRIMAEKNRQINSYHEDISASAIDIYEKNLLLDVLREDLSFYKETYAEKQFEMWTSNQENERKISEHELLNKKLVQERSNFERLQNLVQDLEKNTLPNEEIPESWFQSFEQEKKKFKILRKERLALEKEKASIREKLEKYEYAEFKIRRVSQSMSNLNLDETDRKKKSKNDRMKIKN